jgi:hypothetical protein
LDNVAIFELVNLAIFELVNVADFLFAATPSPNLYRQMTSGSNITSGRLTIKTPPAPRTSPASHRQQGTTGQNLQKVK